MPLPWPICHLSPLKGRLQAGPRGDGPGGHSEGPQPHVLPGPSLFQVVYKEAEKSPPLGHLAFPPPRAVAGPLKSSESKCERLSRWCRPRLPPYPFLAERQSPLGPGLQILPFFLSILSLSGDTWWTASSAKSQQAAWVLAPWIEYMPWDS